ncbi:MAG: nitroreductase [Defluviitaleaceae bacterium]|nr:nitroreductase [Defluviitaleaceae bacterium]
MWEKTELDRLCDTIYLRKSVRKYEQAPLDQAMLDSVINKTRELTALSTDTVAFRILTKQQVKGMNPVKAPHYLAVYAKEDTTARINAGFVLQQIDLWLSAQRLGTCWLGMPNAAKDVRTADGLPFVIMLSFGHPAEEVHRKDVSEFKRKALPEITNVSGIEQLLEPVRLAPSAVNRQPWYLIGSTQALRVCRKSSGFVMGAVMGDMPKIDIGIALCHLWLSAQKNDSFASFERENSPKDIPSGYTYDWTMNLKT